MNTDLTFKRVMKQRVEDAVAKADKEMEKLASSGNAGAGVPLAASYYGGFKEALRGVLRLLDGQEPEHRFWRDPEAQSPPSEQTATSTAKPGERREFEMTEEDLQKLLKACQPVPYMVIGGMAPASPQENANIAWQALGRKLGFKWDTVMPVRGKGQRFFTAEPVVEEEW